MTTDNGEQYNFTKKSIFGEFKKAQKGAKRANFINFGHMILIGH